VIVDTKNPGGYGAVRDGVVLELVQVSRQKRAAALESAAADAASPD